MSTELAIESPGARRLIWGLSAFVVVAVTLVIYPGQQRTEATGPGTLATLNAVLNGAASVFLILGFVFIRARNIAAHRASMLAAFAISSAFLVTYLMHHAQVGSVPFRGQGLIRAVYFAILVPHIVLAAAVVPLALLTLYRGWTQRLALHRKIARYTLPIWLYVSLSGVVVYVMLYHL